jgi:hypothetical protein
VCLLAAGMSNARAVDAYRNAASCTTAPPPGALECRLSTTATVLSAGTPGTGGASMHVLVNGVDQPIDPAASGDRARLDAVIAGQRVGVVTWSGAVTEVATPGGTVHTAADPASGPLTRAGSVAGVIGAMGIVIALVVVAESVPARVRWLLTARSRPAARAAPVGAVSLNSMPPPAPAASPGPA